MTIFLPQHMRNILKSALSQPRICRPPPSQDMVRFLWEMRNVLKIMIHEIIFFCDFIFQVIVKINRKLGWWLGWWWNKNRKNLKFWFFFQFSGFQIFHVNLKKKKIYWFWCMCTQAGNSWMPLILTCSN